MFYKYGILSDMNALHSKDLADEVKSIIKKANEAKDNNEDSKKV